MIARLIIYNVIMISGIANIQYIYYYDIPEINSSVYFLNLLSTFLTVSFRITPN